MGLIKSIFGTYSERELKHIYPIVDRIEALSEEYKAMSDAQLQAKTGEFKERLQKGETLDDILPEAYRHRPGGRRPGAGPAALPGAAGGRRRAAPGPHRRDEDR